MLQTTANRMGAKLVPEYILNVTPPEQYELLEMKRMSGYVDRAQGLGKMCIRDRRRDSYSDALWNWRYAQL